MYETNYHRPKNIEDAAKLFASLDDPKFLAGGQTLLPTMKQRLAAPSDVIDLCHITELGSISVSADSVTIGATVTHAEVACSADVRKAIPALADLAGHIGDPHVRHKGTIGGSLANNDPAADYPAAALALDAVVKTNTRSINASDFFNGLFETSLDDGEMIVSVTFTVPKKAAYMKFPNPASRYAMAGVMVAELDGGTRVGVTGASSEGAFRHSEMEDALSSNWSADAIANASVDESVMLSDIHGSAAYRANLVKVMAKRAVAAA